MPNISRDNIVARWREALETLKPDRPPAVQSTLDEYVAQSMLGRDGVGANSLAAGNGDADDDHSVLSGAGLDKLRPIWRAIYDLGKQPEPEPSSATVSARISEDGHKPVPEIATGIRWAIERVESFDGMLDKKPQHQARTGLISRAEFSHARKTEIAAGNAAGAVLMENLETWSRLLVGHDAIGRRKPVDTKTLGRIKAIVEDVSNGASAKHSGLNAEHPIWNCAYLVGAMLNANIMLNDS